MRPGELNTSGFAVSTSDDLAQGIPGQTINMIHERTLTEIAPEDTEAAVGFIRIVEVLSPLTHVQRSRIMAAAIALMGPLDRVRVES